MGIFCFSLVWLLIFFHLFWSEGNILLLLFVVADFLDLLLDSTAFLSPLYFSHFFHPETFSGFLEIPGTVIIIKRLSRAPIYSTRWEHRVLHNNTNNTCTHTHTYSRVGQGDSQYSLNTPCFHDQTLHLWGQAWQHHSSKMVFLFMFVFSLFTLQFVPNMSTQYPRTWSPTPSSSLFTVLLLSHPCASQLSIINSGSC